ncbi:MAG TPA: YetF domain-containing protein [Bacteroidia bacterium]|jgi:uncharacterized membrane protein YcaP (DUF421 family)
MNEFRELIGEGAGKDIGVLQMIIRACFIFVIALIYIRFSGRRSFGMRSPFDNVIAILLGAILGAALYGSAPFIPTICAAGVIAFLHRLFAWISYHWDPFGVMVKGDARIIYKDGMFQRRNMERCCVSEKDLMEEIRLEGNIESLDEIERAYIERNGKISVIKKKKE